MMAFLTRAPPARHGAFNTTMCAAHPCRHSRGIAVTLRVLCRAREGAHDWPAVPRRLTVNGVGWHSAIRTFLRVIMAESASPTRRDECPHAVWSCIFSRGRVTSLGVARILWAFEVSFILVAPLTCHCAASRPPSAGRSALRPGRRDSAAAAHLLRSRRTGSCRRPRQRAIAELSAQNPPPPLRMKLKSDDCSCSPRTGAQLRSCCNAHRSGGGMALRTFGLQPMSTSRCGADAVFPRASMAAITTSPAVLIAARAQPQPFPSQPV